MCSKERSAIFLSMLWLVLPLAAQESNTHATLYPEIRHAKTMPLREMKNSPHRVVTAEPDQDAESTQRQHSFVPQAQTNTSTQVARTALIAPVSVTTGLNFEGVDADGTRATPDTNGAVGATQYVQWVNLRFEVFDKTTGNSLLGPLYGTTLWSALGSGDNCANDDGDIVVEYDRIANVWVMSLHAYPVSGGAPYSLCVAVSQTSDATGAWNAYDFVLPANFPDYPKLAVWPDAYYVSINEQNPLTFQNLGGLACALDRSSMIAGTTARAMQCFQQTTAYESLLPSDLDGSTLPPSGSPNYYLNLGSNSLNLWKFHVDWTTPSNTTFTGPTVIPVLAFTKACGGSSTCVPQLGTNQLLDGLGDRLMFRVPYRHFADGHESLVASHSIGSTAAVRWYEIQNPAGTPELVQQQTFAPDSSWRWMPSVAMDQMGDIALGYSVSSSTMAPAIRYTGRLQSDPLNTMETENSIVEGSAVEAGSNRWGDYSSMSVDPTDDCTFFYTNQYLQTTGDYNWSTRIASFKFPSCTSTPPVTLSPYTVFFTSYAVGVTSPSQTVTLKNNQGVTLNISSITPSGDFAQTNTCGSSVTAGGTCTFTITFTPTAQGTRTGQIVIADDAAGSSQQVINLTGTGGGPIATFSQSNLAFSVLVKSSLAKSTRLTNTGSSALNLNSLSVSGDYALSGNCTTATFLSPTQSCTLTVTFTPSVTGSVPGAVTLLDNSPGSPHLVILSGTGLTTLAVSPLSLNLGTIAVGASSAAQTVTVTNNAVAAQTFTYGSGGNFTVASGGTTPCGPSPASVNGLSKCTLSVTFSPTASGSIKGAVSVTDTASGVLYNPQVVDVNGTGSGGATPALGFQPTSLAFGNVVVGVTSAVKTVSVKNTSVNSVTINSLTAAGDFALSSTGTSLCKAGTILKANGTCNIGVTFTPSIAGSPNGSITIADNAPSGPTTQIYNLTGIGVWPVMLSPVSMTFPAQAVRTTSAAQVMTIKNYTTAAVTLSSIVASGDYAIVSAGGSPCGSSVAAAVGQTPGSCTVGVTFTPATTGTIKGAVSVVHNATGGNSPQVIGLSGTGQ